MKLRGKIVIPTVVILLITVLVIGVSSYKQAYSLAYEMMIEELENSTKSIRGIIRERQGLMEITKSHLNAKIFP